MRVSRPLGSSGAGDCIGQCSPDSKIRFMPGSQGLPVSFNIFNAVMLPRQLGRSLISLFCIERTRRDFIDSISSGISVSLFRLISRIVNWVSPNICNLSLSYFEVMRAYLTACGISLNRLSRRFRYFKAEQFENS